MTRAGGLARGSLGRARGVTAKEMGVKARRVGILVGGMSSEREISLSTGKAIYEALQARGHEVSKIEVGRDLDRVLREAPVDVAFLALHGTYGEDGCVQGLLEILGIPYTGSGVMASALAMDKLKSKQLFELFHVPTPAYFAVHEEQLDELAERHTAVGFPAFVKPRSQGSSVGAGKALDFAELRARCEDALRYDDYALVERFVAGREATVAVLDGKALGAIEITPKGGFYDYQSKYSAGQSEYHYPARLPADRYAAVLRTAERAAQALEVTGAVRVDFLLTESEGEYVLEVNTLPGMTPTSLLPKIAKANGYDFGALCEAILERARLHQRRPEDIEQRLRAWSATQASGSQSGS